MAKKVFLQFFILSLCLLQLPAHSMEESSALKHMHNAATSVDFINFFISVGEYADALLQIEQNNHNLLFDVLVRQDSDIEQWLDEHVELLCFVRETVVIKRGMPLPFFFLRNTNGRQMDDDVMPSLLKRAGIDNGISLRSLVYLFKKLHIIKTGTDFFAPDFVKRARTTQELFN
jgi:hypothetical protein